MSDFVRGTVGKVAIIAAFTIAIGMAVILAWEYSAVGKFANDFSVYWRVANNPASEAYFWTGRFPFPYAPTMMVWIIPLHGAWINIAFLSLTLGSVLAIFIATRPYLSKAAFALTLFSPAMVRGLYTGQVSAGLAAIIIWACGTRDRLVAGIAFGAVASIKPQLVLMAPLMLVLNKDWRALRWSAITLMILVTLSLLLFGPERWPEWIASMDHFHRAVAGTNIINIGVSPAVVAEKFGLNPIAFLIVGTLAGAALVYHCRNTEGLEKATAIGAGSLLAAPYALAYDLVILVPFLSLMLMKGRVSALFAVPTTLHPLPLVIAIYELIRRLPPLRWGWPRSGPYSRLTPP